MICARCGTEWHHFARALDVLWRHRLPVRCNTTAGPSLSGIDP
jgi:hypothetical protein